MKSLVEQVHSVKQFNQHKQRLLSIDCQEIHALKALNKIASKLEIDKKHFTAKQKHENSLMIRNLTDIFEGKKVSHEIQ